MSAGAPRSELLRAIEGVAARLRFVRGLRSAAASAAALLLAIGIGMLLAKANVAIPRAVAGATAGAIVLASVAASARRGPGVREAAWLLDRRAGGAERFTTWLELSEGDPFRLALERECRAIAGRADAAAIAPLTLPRAAAPVAGFAVLLCVVALVVPRAGDAERARNRTEGSRVRAAVGDIGNVPGREAAGLRQDLLTIAATLERGQLDPRELARALGEARRAAERAKALARVPEALATLAKEFAALERLAGAFELGAREGGAEDAAAALASGRGPRGAAARDEAAAALLGSPELAPLARAIEAGHASRAAAEAERLKAEVAGAADVRVALAGAAARLEAAARKLGVGAGTRTDTDTDTRTATDTVTRTDTDTDTSTGTGTGGGERTLPPRIELAVRRYFTDQEVPR